MLSSANLKNTLWKAHGSAGLAGNRQELTALRFAFGDLFLSAVDGWKSFSDIKSMWILF